jgi:hypothetical protein
LYLAAALPKPIIMICDTLKLKPDLAISHKVQEDPDLTESSGDAFLDPIHHFLLQR